MPAKKASRTLARIQLNTSFPFCRVLGEQLGLLGLLFSCGAADFEPTLLYHRSEVAQVVGGEFAKLLFKSLVDSALPRKCFIPQDRSDANELTVGSHGSFPFSSSCPSYY